jgi:positive regulator of sigma E activity
MVHPEDVVAVFIPIVMFLVIGFILIAYFYFSSREKQMLIEKGFTIDEIKELYRKKITNQNVMLKLGIILICFGVGLFLGLLIEDWFHKDYYIPFFIFVGIGTGFLFAHKYGKEKS